MKTRFDSARDNITKTKASATADSDQTRSARDSIPKAVCGLNAHMDFSRRRGRMDSHDKSRDFVTVSVAGLIFVHVAERVKFDAIELQVCDHGIQPWGHRLVTKRMEHGSLTVVFLHWLPISGE